MAALGHVDAILPCSPVPLLLPRSSPCSWGLGKHWVLQEGFGVDRIRIHCI